MAHEADGDSAIYLFEICDAILTACAVRDPNTTVSRSCGLCIENQAALAALVKGANSSEFGAVLVGVSWGLDSLFPFQRRRKYASTKSNDPDEPSRVSAAHMSEVLLPHEGRCRNHAGAHSIR